MLAVIAHSLAVTVLILLGVGSFLAVWFVFSYWRFLRASGNGQSNDIDPDHAPSTFHLVGP